MQNQQNRKLAQQLLNKLLKDRKPKRFKILKYVNVGNWSIMDVYDKERNEKLFSLVKYLCSSPESYNPYSTGEYLTQYESKILFNEIENMCFAQSKTR